MPEHADDGLDASAPAVLQQRILETGRPGPPESSQVQPSERTSFPSEPPGVYVDEHATDQPYDSGPDTNPAPPLDPSEHEEPWADETTTFVPVGVPVHTTEENPDEDDWGGDSTQIIDPRSAEGNG